MVVLIFSASLSVCAGGFAALENFGISVRVSKTVPSMPDVAFDDFFLDFVVFLFALISLIRDGFYSLEVAIIEAASGINEYTFCRLYCYIVASFFVYLRDKRTLHHEHSHQSQT